MKNAYINCSARILVRYFALCLLFFPCKALSQDFGDDLMRWVKNDANNESREFTKQHWELYWQNYHILLHEKLNYRTTKIDSTITDMIRVSREAAFQVDTTNIAQYMRLKELYNSQMNKLYTIIGDIEQMKNQLNKGSDSLDEFLIKGYSHHGRTTLLESFAKVNNGTNDIAITYGNTFNKIALYALGNNGNGGRQNNKPPVNRANSDSDYEVDFTYPEFGPKNEWEEAVYYTGMALISSGEPYSQMAGAAILTVYSVYKFSEQQKYKKQLEIFSEAIALMPSKLISDKDAYQIYADSYKYVKSRYDSLKMNRYRYLQKLDSISSSLLRHSFQTLSLCNTILQGKKIEKLSQQYFDQPEIFSSIFQHQRLVIVAGEMNNYSKELGKLKLKMLQEKGLKQIILQEQYYDALIENKKTFEWIVARPEHLPLVPEINNYLKVIDAELLNSRNNAVLANLSFPKTFDSFAKDFNKLKRSIKNYKSIKKSIEEPKYFAEILNIDVPEYVINIPNGPYAYYNVSGSHYSGVYSLGNDITFQYNFNSVGGKENLASSIYDGGFNHDNRSPSAEVDKFKNNIARRKQDMAVSYQKAYALHNKWNTHNLQAINANINTLSRSQSQLESYVFASEELNRTYVDQYDNVLKEMLRNPVSQENLRNFFRDNNISSALFSTIPRHNLRPSGYSSPLFNIRDRFYGATGELERNIAYEAYKSNSQLDAVATRFNEHQRNGTTDPVFPNETSMKQVQYLSRSYLLIAKELTQSKNAFYQRNKKDAKEMANKFVNNARLIRYYSMGLIPQYKLEKTDFFLETSAIRDHLTKHTQEYYSFCEHNGSLESSACNRFTANFLKDVYGIGDFYNKPDGADIALRNDRTVQAVYYNTAQISEFVTRQWTELGGAKDQLALNMAGLLAGMGYAVIAVRPGHVCIILPSNPQEYFASPSWGVNVPYVLNYSLTSDPHLNIKLNIPLSEAWNANNAETVKLYFKRTGIDY